MLSDQALVEKAKLAIESLEPQAKATGGAAHLDHAIVRARHEQHGVSMAEVHTPDALLMGFILGHILRGGDVPHVHHSLVVAAGQVGLQVLVPGQAAELGAGDQLLAGAVGLSPGVGHDGAVLVQADALGHSCCRKHLHDQGGFLAQSVKSLMHLDLTV